MATALGSDEPRTLPPPLRSRATYGRLLRETLRGADHDRVLGLAAEAGFWQLLSLPSLLLGVLGLIGFFGGVLGTGTVDSVQNSVIAAADRLVVPSAVHSTLAPALHRILAGGRADVVSTSFLLSIWTGSSAMSTYVNTITIAYGMRHLRGAVRSRLLALGLYFGFVLVDVVVLPLMVLGPSRIVALMPSALHDTARDLVLVAYWPVVVALCLALLATLYHLALPVRIPWRRALPGAVVALALWLGGSLVLRLWLDWSFRREATYGPLASPIAVLLFLYLLALAVLIGAELNAEVDRLWPLRQTEDARRADQQAALS